jgi:hypothetical protein
MIEKDIKSEINKLDNWIYQLNLTINSCQIEAYITEIIIVDNFLILTYSEEENNSALTIRIPSQSIKSIHIKNPEEYYIMPSIYLVV